MKKLCCLFILEQITKHRIFLRTMPSDKESLVNGELDFAFRFSRNGVAGSGAIAPRKHRVQNTAVFALSGAFQNNWGVHATVGADNKADGNSRLRYGPICQRIWCGKCFRRPRLLRSEE